MDVGLFWWKPGLFWLKIRRFKQNKPYLLALYPHTHWPPHQNAHHSISGILFQRHTQRCTRPQYIRNLMRSKNKPYLLALYPHTYWPPHQHAHHSISGILFQRHTHWVCTFLDGYCSTMRSKKKPYLLALYPHTHWVSTHTLSIHTHTEYPHTHWVSTHTLSIHFW